MRMKGLLFIAGGELHINEFIIRQTFPAVLMFHRFSAPLPDSGCTPAGVLPVSYTHLIILIQVHPFHDLDLTHVLRLVCRECGQAVYSPPNLILFTVKYDHQLPGINAGVWIFWAFRSQDIRQHIIGAGSVSYTHLDVYKRQRLQ